ncbi:MAG: acyltransferase [Vibrionaceae bacterium]
MKERVFFFDLLRCVAAIAVIAIHVLSPYREALNDIGFGQWSTAIAVNSASRWAVPVFILITGALLISDKKPFALEHYIKRRFAKVFIPFIVWSLFYAYFSGWSTQGFSSAIAIKNMQEFWHSPTYYHLGFFYYFIPLYFVIPIFKWLENNNYHSILYTITALWLISCTLYLFKVNGWWDNKFWLFMGYLPAGYLLYTKIPNNKQSVLYSGVFGIVAITITFIMVVYLSLQNGHYSIGRWLSYNTINVVMAAAMVFIFCRYIAENLPNKVKSAVIFISKHSLGVYLLHPIFLWPMKNYQWYNHHPALIIPLWIIISGSLSLLLSHFVAQSKKTQWLLP